jgi:hypothetical protein
VITAGSAASTTMVWSDGQSVGPDAAHRMFPVAVNASSVSIMASNVWVLAPKNHKYIRGSEIIEVTVHTPRGYGASDEKDSTITITQARTVGNKAGTCPDTLDLWTFAKPGSSPTKPP